MTDLALRDMLVNWEFWWLELQFAILVVTTAIVLQRAAIWRRRIYGPLILAGIAWLLTVALPPRTNRIFYDEQIYQGIAQNLSDRHRAEMCNEGRVEYGRLYCARGEYNKEPYGYPYLLSMAYRLGGVSESWAFRVNNAGAGLAVFVTIGLGALLFENSFAALTAGLVLMLLPIQLIWSNTAAAEPWAALLCGAAVLAAVHFARTRTTSALWCMVAIGAFATTLRPESILVLPVIGLALLFLAPGEFARRRTWWAALAGLALTAATIGHLLAVRYEGWGTSSGRLSWSYVATNLPVNFWFYFADERFPALVGLAALVGLFAGGRRKERLVLLVYFLTFWIVFVFFYAGSYNYGADVRYSLMSYIPIAVLAGRGFERIASAVSTRLARPSSSRVAFAVTQAVLAFQFLWYVPLVRERGEEAWAARADVTYAKVFAAALPPNSIVLTHNPSMFLLWGVDAGQLSIATNEPAYVREQLFPRYAGGVYVHWNFWCNVVDPVQVQFCKTPLDTFQHDLVESREERDYRFSLYRLRK